jgi:hypothetical protein
MKIIYIIGIFLLLNGCSVKEVKPWEKGTLAKDSMKKDMGNTLFTKFTNHIYFSKEASKGGGGVAGGGCGCN